MLFMDEINFLGAIFGGIFAFLVGLLWYSRWAFGFRWCSFMGCSYEDLDFHWVSFLVQIASLLLLSFVIAVIDAGFDGFRYFFVLTLLTAWGSFGRLSVTLWHRRPFRLWVLSEGCDCLQILVIIFSVTFL